MMVGKIPWFHRIIVGSRGLIKGPFFNNVDFYSRLLYKIFVLDEQVAQIGV